MGVYRHFLFGIDGSAASLQALQVGLRLADPATRLTAVSVAPPYEGDLGLLGIGDVAAKLRQPCEAALTRAQELAAVAGVELRSICALGEPYQRLVELADSEACDLLVIGARGMTAWEKMLLGRVARRVIGLSSQDVLVVPEQAHYGWQQLLLATDLAPASRAAENRALELAEAYNSGLTILSVLEAPPYLFGEAGTVGCKLPPERTQALAAVQEAATTAGIRAEVLTAAGDAAALICRLAREKQAGMIIIGSHGRSGLKRLLLGSTAEKVIGQAPCPVLVVKPGQF